MSSVRATYLILGAFALIAAQRPSHSVVGTFLCTTVQRTAIASDHREGTGQLRAFVDEGRPTIFRMQIKADRKAKNGFRLTELPYAGPDRDQGEWQDENSVLHDTYLGDGKVFEAVGSPAFMTVAMSRAGDLEFYHAGFELPGGEDTQLAIRWGKCMSLR